MSEQRDSSTDSKPLPASAISGGRRIRRSALYWSGAVAVLITSLLIWFVMSLKSECPYRYGTPRGDGNFGRTQSARPASDKCLLIKDVSSIPRDGLGALLLVAIQSHCMHPECTNRVVVRDLQTGEDRIRLEPRGTLIGVAVCGLGDADGDGLGDFAVSTVGGLFHNYSESASGSTSPIGEHRMLPGEVWICSGRTGRELWRIVGPLPGGNFGAELTNVGDVDGDGVGELAIGCTMAARSKEDPTSGHVVLYSVAKRTELYRTTRSASLVSMLRGPDYYGASIVRAGDADSDGVVDFLVGAPGAGTLAGNAVGSLTLHSGRDGAVLEDWHGEWAEDGFGWSSLVTDLDGDGRSDLLCAAPGRYLRFYPGLARQPAWETDVSVSGPGYTGLGTSFALQRTPSGLSGVLLGSDELFPDNDEYSLWRLAPGGGPVSSLEWSGSNEYSVQQIDDIDGDALADVIAYGPFSLVMKLWSSATDEWSDVLIK